MFQLLSQFLGLGPTILLPIIIVIIGLIVKMKFKDTIFSALMLAVAFTSINIVVGFMFETISPVATDFVKNTGITLNVIDLGFSPMVAVAFAWKYSIIMFPLQILINIFMIHFHFTNILNVDIFNVWTKIFTAALVSILTGSTILGFIAAIVHIILELKTAESLAHRMEEMSGIPRTVTTNACIIEAAFMKPINDILDKIKFIRESNFDLDHIKKKIGILSEDAVMGALIGLVLAVFAGYSIKDSVEIAIKLATTLVLLPTVSFLFVKSLTPVSQYAKRYMEKKYEGRDIYIGLDWTVLSGVHELWIVSVLLIPITLVLAIILSKLGLSSILPLPGLVNTMVVVPAIIVANRNILKALILSTIFSPFYFIISSFFAPAITDVTKTFSQLDIKATQLVSYYCLESPIFRWVITVFLQFKIYGIILFIFLTLIYIYSYIKFKKEK